MQLTLVLHNILRWAVLLFGIWAIINAISGISSNRKFTGSDKKVNLFFMISCDIQLVIGLILYFTGPYFAMLKSDAGVVMKNSTLRFFAVEHISMMVIAWILVHVGISAIKKADADAKRFKKMAWFFGIALLIIFASIPWPFREAIARPLIPALN
jgi:hypothetical protein